MRNIYLLLSALLLPALSWAQPVNDECQNAILLTDLENYCSGVGEFSNAGATASPQVLPSCFPQDGPVDVWFAFVAQATTVNISVKGNTGLNSGGTLLDPQLALYSGDCGAPTEEECISDAFNNNVVETFGGPLELGQTYYIRVSARNGQTGSFQLCVNNFNAVPDPSGDCPTGVVLCDKSAFTVENVIGEGNDPNEITGNTCVLEPGCSPAEFSSSWYRWTCEDPGSLSFTITPTNPADDIDFVLYELPSGIDDCSNKEALRCMFSGENVGQPFVQWEPCTGATGLLPGDGDTAESCGCQDGNNNFLEEIQMQAGQTYALFISNFSNSGSGFSIEFGGTGTFLGPTAEFETDGDTVCFGQTITFNDASFFPGGSIVARNWNFGLGSSPQTTSGTGPHAVSWDGPGLKNILLTVESGEGCIVSEIKQVFVDSCCTTFNAITASADVSELECWYDTDGFIDLSANSNALPHTFAWSTGATAEDLNNLLPGQYAVTVTNEATCQEVFEFEIDAPPPIEPAFDIGMPTCDGGQDGVLSVLPSGGTPAYAYSFNGGGFTPDNSLLNIPIGFYDITIQDANGCILDTTVEVTELVLELDSLVEFVNPPSCFGFSDGSITVTIANGQPPYLYDLNDGNGFTPNNTLQNLPAGTYPVQVLDANNCEGNFNIIVEDPPPLTLDFDTLNVSCFGAADGILTALVGGGVGNYSYNWSTGGAGPEIGPLDTGLYQVTVLDGNGCEIQGEAPITQPPVLIIEDLQVSDLLCFGDTNGEVLINAQGGTPPYVYSVAGGSVQIDSLITGLPGGNYTAQVEDANGCLATAGFFIDEPPQIDIDAGPDITIELGDNLVFNSVLTPIFWEVAYAWTGPEGSLSCLDCPRPTAMPVNDATYTVMVTDSNGCTASDEVQVVVEKIRPIYIPNVFSPNDDGRNDFFTIFGGPAADRIQLLRIYSRWGELVFEARNVPLSDPLRGWDGTFRGQRMDPGVFAFYAEVGFIDGEVILYEGDVTIVR